MEVILKVLVAILKIIFPVIIQSARDLYSDANEQVDVTQKIKDRVESVWGRVLVLFCCVIFLSGCFTRTVYVPDQTPIRLRESVNNVKIWIMDNDGRISESTIDLREGWFVISLPKYPLPGSDYKVLENIK